MKPITKSLSALAFVVALMIGVYVRNHFEQPDAKSGQPRQSQTAPLPPPEIIGQLKIHKSSGVDSYLKQPDTKTIDDPQKLVKVSDVRHGIMSTSVQITVYAKDEDRGRATIQKAFDRIHNLEQMMSGTIKGNKLDYINSLKADTPFKLSPEMMTVLKKSIAISKLTDGTFDITVQPLIDMYRRTRGNPTDQQFAETMKRVGYKKIKLDEKNQTLTFATDGMALALGGIAKGFIVDEAINTLKENGIKHMLVNAGGDTRGVGGHPNGQPWKTGVQDPRLPGEQSMKVLNARTSSIVTSGHYRRFTNIKGKRRSHILNPVTGKPTDTENNIISITVIGPDCMTADALATGISVLGIERGLKLAESIDGVDVLILEKEEKKE